MISSADLQHIDTLLFDADGTLTDGKISFDSAGNTLRSFNIKDMHWLKLARRAGLKTGMISGQDDPALRRFAAETGMDLAVYGAKDKVAALETLISENGVDPQNTLYAGDDVVDLPLFKRVRIGVAVADAVAELDEYALWRTAAPGGNGAAVEIVRRVLDARGSLNKIMERYRR